MSRDLIPGLRRAARGARRLRSAVLDPVRRWRADRCFRLESRDRDAYLVSYPRSGRHWVGFFLATLIRSRIPDPPERIDFHTWERVVPNIDRMIPEHMLRIRAYRHRPDPRIFLSHHQSDPRMRRAVYLVRDPRDAVVSQFHEHQRRFAQPIRELGAFVEAALAGRIWPGPGGGHVEGWRDELEPHLARRIEETWGGPMARLGYAPGERA